MRSHQLGLAMVVSLALSAPAALAQVPPFIGGGVVAFDPEIGVVSSGTGLPTRSMVSDDRKYVTITPQPTVAQLRSLVTFPVSTVLPPGQGFVGGVILPTVTNNANGNGAAPVRFAPNASSPSTPSPAALDHAGKTWMLEREGMFLVKRLD